MDEEISYKTYGYNNLLAKDMSLDELGSDKTNAVDMSNGINNFNSNAIIGKGAISLDQTTISPYAQIYIPAECMNKTTTSGCSSLTKVEATTNDIDYWVLDFDTTTAESCFFTLKMPDNWDGKTINFQFVWTNASGTTGQTVTWGIKGFAYTDADTIEQTYGSELTVTDTWLAQNAIHITDETDTIQLSGKPSGGDWCQFKITRKTGTDNMTGDARLIGVMLKYKFV